MLLSFCMLGTFACSLREHNTRESDLTKTTVTAQLERNNQAMIKATTSKAVEDILALYADDAMLLAEYHPLVHNRAIIRKYYQEIFERQDLLDYTRETIEVLDFEKRVIELGLFRKTFTNQEVHRGKFFNVWEKNTDGHLQLKAAAFGYLHPIEDPAPLVIASIRDEHPPLQPIKGVEIPWEMEAYTALNETLVMDRNPVRSANAYTLDGSYFPFADTLKSGRAELLKHYQAYYRHPAKIDSIQGWTYNYDVVEDGYIRYTKFYVDWTVPGFSGNTQGTGISYWRREADQSLRLHRQIGLHIHQD